MDLSPPSLGETPRKWRAAAGTRVRHWRLAPPVTTRAGSTCMCATTSLHVAWRAHGSRHKRSEGRARHAPHTRGIFWVGLG